MELRNVTVELLRAGPPNNQLLSPLTQYLGVCSEAGAGVVTLPYEHYKFERRFAQLRYEDGADEDPGKRLELLHSTGEDMAAILAAVPGLAGAVTGSRESLTHLRLVLSASELSLLPFELSKVPTGSDLPTENWLLLQAIAPVCLTRHIRSVPTDDVRWPTRPRVLFVAGDRSDIPFDEHLGALQEAVAPWIGARGIGDWLTVLEDTTLEEIQKTCARTQFTHVHILAHGAEDEMVAGTSFGLSLRDRDGMPDVVSGERLASAFASLASGQRHRPTVVTLASCDSGNQGDVKTPGASFAHSLHQAGIPLVVASQFPLSKEGSVALVDLLYSGLLWGENPLLLLHKLRSELHSRFNNHSHDWASVVVYEALPPDLDKQLEETVYRQTRGALGAALEAVEQAVATGDGMAGEEKTEETGKTEATEEAEQADADEPDRFDGLVERIEVARSRLPEVGPFAVECLGLRAASHKRLAEVEFRRAAAPGLPEAVRTAHLESCIAMLEDAFDGYQEAVRRLLLSTGDVVHRQASLHWVLVQALALGEILGRPMEPGYWMIAKLSAQVFLRHSVREEIVWAHGSLAELWLLKLADARLSDQERFDAVDKARSHVREIVAEYRRPGAFPVMSTRRQFERYTAWWGSESFAHLRGDDAQQSGWGEANGVVATAESLVATLDPPARRRSAAKAKKKPTK